MTSHPVSQPIVHQFLHAEDDAVRAALMLATPWAVLERFQGQYRKVCVALAMAEGEAYLDAILAALAARRDAFGNCDPEIAMQLRAAQVRLCIAAGSVAIVPVSKA
ncbi:hypothetical protein [Oricola cellulosilytica]|uniref:Uncharacterized protein n=1 Tax=Oricola cellulosilytica TaxID=1429082 RepID=A0A4R0PCG9_9HYPH|nr:hypothetical protein [Oricola cellulosilytica]TCD15160.1 hypothetical protein E0D97_06320 [Oricola cellulosilytica]